jgi:tetratricopeptide (TPR) repeat protein/serine/threonine protein kinase
MPADLRKAREFFLHAVGSLPPERWDAYVGEACGSDAELAQQVKHFLQVHREAGSFLERPAVELGDTGEFAAEPCLETLAETTGTIIGPYKLLEQIGEGGFGVVFMALQQEPIRRKVALKVVKPGMDTKQVIARFEAERQALALMDHANIAKVLDAGQTTSGRPYFVMDLVKGRPITDYCDQAHLKPRQRLELFVSVCQAVQHAHQKGIIHRDIKPSNVLVTVQDGTPLVRVIDFGIAKALGQQLTDKTVFTGFAQMIGTPLYMSPEQAALSNVDVDTRSDIYSLGVLLYELLTGTTPFVNARLHEVDYDEMRRIIREEEPPKPSTRLSDSKDTLRSISELRDMEPAGLMKFVRGELDWIVMKALEKDRARRFETASALAADVQHFLHDEPVAACPPSARYRLGKFARRNRAALTMAAIVTAAVVLVTAALGWMLRDSAVRRKQAANAVATALAEARQRLEQGNWRAGQAVMRRAEELLIDAGGNAEFPARWQQINDDLKMLARFEEARLLRTGVKDEWFNDLGAAGAYEDAFRTYQLPVLNMEPQEAADRIAASEIAKELLAALIDWASLQPITGGWGKLLEVSQLAARGSGLRQVPESMAQRDWSRLLRLAQQPGALDQRPETLALLGRAMFWVDPSAAVDFLRRAQYRHPADFWINHDLAATLMRLKPRAAQEAIGFFRAALALSSESPGVHVNLGRALEATGDLDGAIAEYRKAIELKSDYSAPHSNIASALTAKGLKDEAITEYRTAIELDPKDAHAHYNLGNTLRAKNQLDEAGAEYRKAIGVAPEFALAHLNLGVVLHDKNQLDEAIDEYRKAIEHDPNCAPAHNNLGNVLRAKNQLDEASAEYHKAIELDPEYAVAHLNLGRLLYQRKQFDKAMAEYQKAIEHNPNLALAHYNLGQILETKQPDKAIVEYRKAIELDPKHMGAHVNLGAALHRKNQLKESIAEYGKAIALDPKFTLAWNNRGLAYQQLGQWDQALADYTKITELEPMSASAWQQRGGAQLQRGHTGEAIADFTRAIGLDPKNASRHNGLAWLLATHPNPKARDPRQAVNWAKKATELVPEDGDYWNTLGVAHYRAGQWEAAIAALEKSMVLTKGGNSGDWFFLAMSQEKLGDKEKARQWYDRATRWMDKNQAKNEELRRFRAEAAELLSIDKVR